MSKYTEASDLVVYEGKYKLRLVKPLTFRIGHKFGPEYVVPKGFFFDVSVPRWMRWLFSPHDKRYFKAAAIHDHMILAGWDRVTAGAVFHSALKADQVPAWRRVVMWTAVSFYRYQ